MKKTLSIVTCSIITATVLGLGYEAIARNEAANKEETGPRYEVTITNLTRGQIFTPIMVASHKSNTRLFTLGAPASPELELMAEFGDTSGLQGQLYDSARDIQDAGALPPGHTVTVSVKADAGADHISLAAMLIPTNDGFIALNGVAAPKGNETVNYRVPAYDAGTEPNDELCASIPGPVFVECEGQDVRGGSPEDGAEGYVHIHAGIHGIGDLDDSERDWRNPVANITIRRVSK